MADGDLGRAAPPTGVPRWETAGYALALLVLLRAGFSAVLGTKGGSPALVAGWAWAVPAAQLGTLAWILALSLRHLRRLVLALAVQPALGVVSAVALTSVIWSPAPVATARASAGYLVALLLGLLLGVRLTPKQQLRLFLVVFAVVMVASVFAVLGIPALGVAGGGHRGEWQGIFEHKNALGMRAALSALVAFVSAASERGRRRWSALALVALSLVVLLGSGSKTSLVAWTACMLVWPILIALRGPWLRLARLLSGGLLVASVVAALLLPAGAVVLAAVNPKGTLVGRAELWTAVATEIGRRPLLGYGLDGFWNAPNELVGPFRRQFPWGPNHAHNGLLNSTLSVGLLGVGILLIHGAGTLVLALISARTARTAEGSWPLLYVLYLLIINLTYSNLLGTGSAFWLLYVAIGTSLRGQASGLARFVPGSRTARSPTGARGAEPHA